MRKRVLYIILLIVSLTFLLSGCFKLDIDIGVDEYNTAFLSYSVEMDLEEFDMRYKERLTNALNRIGWYYQEELGFVVELDIENNPSRLVMTKRVENGSFEQAYKSLENMLKNEDMTPFMQVDMAFNSGERQNRYIFNAITDISQVMRLSNAEELSPALQEELEKAIETGEGSITLTLPASEVISSSHSVEKLYNHAIMAAPLSYTEQTELEILGILNLHSDGTPAGSLHEIIHDLNKFRNLSIIISLAVLVLLLIVILLRKLSKNKR